MELNLEKKPTLLIKKVLGLIFIFAGLFMIAMGASSGSTGLIILGILSIALGMVALMLKVARRNQSNS